MSNPYSEGLASDFDSSPASGELEQAWPIRPVLPAARSPLGGGEPDLPGQSADRLIWFDQFGSDHSGCRICHPELAPERDWLRFGTWLAIGTASLVLWIVATAACVERFPR